MTKKLYKIIVFFNTVVNVTKQIASGKIMKRSKLDYSQVSYIIKNYKYDKVIVKPYCSEIV